MVEIYWENPAGKFPARLELKGHANYSAAGKDPICAAVSTLFYTAAALAEEMEKKGQLWQPPTVTATSGYGLVEFSPKPLYHPMASAKWEAVAMGFSLLSRYYPKYVRVYPQK